MGFGFKRLGLGWIYMAMHLVGSMYVPEGWVRTEEFGELGFVARSFWFTVWVKVSECESHYYDITSREPGNGRGNSGFPELLGTSPAALRAIRGPLRGPAQPFGLILRKLATLNCGSGNPETWHHE